MGDRPWCVGFGFGCLLVALCYLQGWVWFPPVFTWQTYALLGICCAICLFNYLNEYLQYYPLKYSKFAPDGGVPARVGWFLAYFVPVVVYLVLWAYLGAPASTYDLFIITLYCAHFTKRCLEVIFLHKYSKDMVLQTVIEIAGFYSVGAVVTCYSTHVLIGPARHSFLDDTVRVKVGLGVYTVGQLCNFVHHVILASLRAPGNFRYVVPTGGLFSLVICPQYLGELLAWLGFAIAGYSYGLYLSYIPMVAYLAARAHHTYRWYKTKFDDYPTAYTGKLWPLVY